MDTVLFQTKEPEDFAVAATSAGDANTNVVAGTYGGNIVNGPPTALAPVSLMTINSKDQLNTSQILVDAKDSIYIRYFTGGTTPSTWKQLGTMEYDDVLFTLDIFL